MGYNLETKKFLAEQIELPQEKWDSKFKQYINESYLNSDVEDLVFDINNKSFIRYLRMFDITEDYLKDKTVLDLGCGKEAEFVKYCLDSKINENVYGIDVQVKPKEVEGKYKGNILRGNYCKKLPLKEVDLIISIGAVFPVNNKKPLINAIKALRVGGEIRIAPVWHAYPDSKNIGILKSRQKLQKILLKIEKEYSIKWQLNPTELHIGGNFKENRNYDNVWLNEVLIIKKYKKL